ncbi:hypothetical protein JCM8097_001949 [Rhodosporidiobolus ruineniae]
MSFPTLEQPTSPAFSSLPPELLLKILYHACTSTRLSAPLLVHNQFTQVETSCRGCVYRRLAGVCHGWRDAVRGIMGREVVLANGCGAEVKDEQVLELVAKDEARARAVKVVDASLRRAMCSWAGWPAMAVPAVSDGTSGDASGGITSQGVELERMREHGLNRERQRLYRLLSHCRLVHTLDVDLGFYPDLRAQPTLLPPTIRTLTLRNTEPLDTLAVVNQLPLLEDLTLRLALDWLLPSSPYAHLLQGKPRLRRFELSTTAFGSTSLPSILALLANSHESLTSLTLRNKGAAAGATEAFYPVARGLIETFAGALEELTVKDIPRAGMRAPGTLPSLDWFPSRPPAYPCLKHLHLTGLPLFFLTLFTSTTSVPSTRPLSSLTVEDFDSLSARPLIDALTSSAVFGRLEELRVAFAREVEMGKREGEAWEKEMKEVEGWCAGEGRKDGRETRLMAGWQMIKVTGCGFW